MRSIKLIEFLNNIETDSQLALYIHCSLGACLSEVIAAEYIAE